MPAKKASTKKTTKKSSRAMSGPVPPYGEAIRGAVARGDKREMKNTAASARKWLADVEAALQQLEGSLK